jgi:putative transposase
MVRFAFRKGLRFLGGTKAFTLMKRLANGNFQFEDDAGEVSNLSETETYKRWRKTEWQIDEESLGASSNVFYFTAPKDLKALPEADQKDVKRRLAYLQGVKKLFDSEAHRPVSTRTQLGLKIEVVAKELGDTAPPSPPTLWRWWKRFSLTQCVTKLVKRSRRAGRRTDPVQKSLFDDAVCEVFLTPQKKPGKAVVEAVENKVKRVNDGVEEGQRIKAPSQATIYRWLMSLHHEIVLRSREGKAAAARELRSAVGSVKVRKILERVELDHTPLDILVLCQITRLILGRPWLTLAIDRLSRMIVGFYIREVAPLV